MTLEPRKDLGTFYQSRLYYEGTGHREHILVLVSVVVMAHTWEEQLLFVKRHGKLRTAMKWREFIRNKEKVTNKHTLGALNEWISSVTRQAETRRSMGSSLAFSVDATGLTNCAWILASQIETCLVIRAFTILATLRSGCGRRWRRGWRRLYKNDSI